MSVSRKVLEALKELGVTLSARPDFPIPMLPRDLTELDDEGLMDLFVQFTQWNDHLSGARAIAVITDREAERILDGVQAQAMLANWAGSKGDRVAVAKASIAADSKVVELKEDLDTKYAFRKLIETRAEDVERNSQVVSRELTRRTSDGGGLRARARRFTT